MAYTATQLINRAWYLSGIVAQNFETVSGAQVSEGLYLLNALLDVKAFDLRLIPYYRTYDFTLTVGQEKYFLENVLDIQTFTFFLDGDVRYPTTKMSRDAYFGTGRINNIQSLPFQWYGERLENGMNLYVYFLPQQPYAAQISAKFALTDVDLNTDMTQYYDNYYIEYLRYALAEYMCENYDMEFPPNKMKTLKEIENKLAFVSPPDLTISKTNFISNKTGIDWQQANLGRGWEPT